MSNERERDIKEKYGAGAQEVPKYKPNRKQKRMQEAAAKAQASANKRSK